MSLELNPNAADRHVNKQLEVQRQAMRRKGIDEHLIAHEIKCMETMIRTLLSCAASGAFV